jgi:hypothetical protein
LVTSKARELSIAIIESQQELRTDTAKVSSKIETMIDSMTTFSRDMRSIEIETVALPNLDAWITNVTSELAHMKAQAVFLHEIFKEEKVGKRPVSTTLRSCSGKSELKKIVRKKSSKL